MPWTLIIVAVLATAAVGALGLLIGRRRERRAAMAPARGAGKQFFVRYHAAGDVPPQR